ncbi:MAG: trigger factor [Verrucomicrobiales bacterium]|nr:trigger factor [Verrucomicrobiales bacterium]
MNISVERLPECKARLSAEIPADTVADTRKEIVAAYTQQAKVPGFRPGKIPTSVIEKRYAGPIEDELKDRLARSAYNEARVKEDLAILGIAQVEREQFEADGSYMLAVEVVTEPEVEIADYKGIPVEVQKMEIEDKMIDDYLTNMAKQQAVPTDVERAAGPGDLAVINYTATLDGAPLADQLEEQAGPLAKGDGHWVDIPEEGAEPQEFIPGLSKAVEGLKSGDSKNFAAEYAEDFPVEAVAGKTVDYEVTVTQVKARELPEINDDFAKAIGAESLEALRENVRGQFTQQQERTRQQIIDNQILGHLNEEMTFDLPQHIVFNETQRQVNQMVSRGYEQGMSENDIQENQEDLLKNAESQAKNNVKTMFILDEIAEKEGITVSEEEVSQRIYMMAMQQKRPVKKVARELRDNNAFGEVRQDIVISKTIEFLRENAVVTEVDPPEEGA